MTNEPSRRVRNIQMPMVPIVGQWISEHPGTISLGQGVVHYGPPPEVRQAVATVLPEARVDRYGPVCGAPELLEAIRDKVERENRIQVGESRSIVVTPGSNKGFVNAVLAIGDPGDEIILLKPYYFNHEMAITMAGCLPVVVPTDADYQIDWPALEAAVTSRTRAIVTVSPNNPTGAVYPAQDLARVNEFCRLRGLYHVSDEAYEQFLYDGLEHFSPASLSGSEGHTISLFTLSKAYGMAGWRAGFMVVPRSLEISIKKIQDTTLVCNPSLSQVAATAALRVGPSWVREKVAGFERVRDTALEQLSALGDRCTIPQPGGAFYMLARLDTHVSDMELVERLIRDYGVAVMPGCTFGVDSGCSLRIAYGALDAGTVAEGMGRLVKGLGRLL